MCARRVCVMVCACARGWGCVSMFPELSSGGLRFSAPPLKDLSSTAEAGARHQQTGRAASRLKLINRNWGFLFLRVLNHPIREGAHTVFHVHHAAQKRDSAWRNKETRRTHSATFCRRECSACFSFLVSFFTGSGTTKAGFFFSFCKHKTNDKVLGCLFATYVHNLITKENYNTSQAQDQIFSRVNLKTRSSCRVGTRATAVHSGVWASCGSHKPEIRTGPRSLRSLPSMKPEVVEGDRIQCKQVQQVEYAIQLHV